jgi:hypothetical protein
MIVFPSSHHTPNLPSDVILALFSFIYPFNFLFPFFLASTFLKILFVSSLFAIFFPQMTLANTSSPGGGDIFQYIDPWWDFHLHTSGDTLSYQYLLGGHGSEKQVP